MRTSPLFAALIIPFSILPSPPSVLAAPPKPKISPHDQKVPPVPLATLSGLRISGDDAYDAQPALAETADGTLALTWIRHHPGGADEVVAALRKGESLSAPQSLTPAPGQYLRPVLAAAGGDLWCLWTASEPDRVSTIWFSRRTGDTWSPAARFLPDETRAHQNPEIAAAPDGRLVVVWQVHTGAGYDIALRRWDGTSWSGPTFLSDASTSDWDPVAVFDAKGGLNVFWSGFRDGDYDIYAVRLDPEHGTLDPSSVAPRRISARGVYDMHPWAAAAPDGSVWVCWDAVTIAHHNWSGRTTITGANLRAAGARDDEVEVHSSGGHRAAIEVRVLDGDTVRIPGRPAEEIVAPKGYLLAHCALPKIAIGADGAPWIVYRALHRIHAPWSDSPRDGYLWEVLARPFRDGRWQDLLQCLASDGYLEEAAVARTAKGVRAAWSTEHRRTNARGVSFHVKSKDGDAGNGDAAYDHHRDFAGVPGWNGDILLGLLPAVEGPAAAAASLPEEPAPADAPASALLARDAGRHEVTANGRTYRLLWGDTHRHSNISRCSVGAEPGPDDLYRYGSDICRYDFVALSDHAEYTTDYYWWLQQKLADLYHVPGAYSVLYNYEWSLRYPHGHHNTIFPSRPLTKLHGWMGESKTLEGGWGILSTLGLKAITIPHTSADAGMGTAWEDQDERYRRLCEIFQSARGAYEHEGGPRTHDMAKNPKGFYWRALEKGYHVGVICSSDHGYGTAYACVYAPENTREAVWQAMWDRRTYGSTTYGLVLEVRSGDRWMGEAWESAEAPAIDVYVRGAAPIRSVEMIGRSKVLHAEGSAEKPLDAAEHRLRWTDPEWAAQTKEQWYYVRVIQTDDEMAWSSPVWVTPKR